jgi:3-deoxy-D-manno-octulosonic-acid transferase
MAELLFGLASKLFFALVWLYSFFNKKARMAIIDRRTSLNALKKYQPNANKKRVWFHCASLGEYEQALPLLQRLDKDKYEIQLSFFSPSGFVNYKPKDIASVVFYLPFDSNKNSKKLIAALQPDVAIFVKYEFWYFILKHLSQHHIKIYLISARFRQNQIFFKWYGSLYKNMLYRYETIFVQDSASESLLNSHNLKHVVVAGDTRFDRVIENKQKIVAHERLEAFCDGYFTVICGSTWEPEEKLINACLTAFPNFKWVIAPHDVGENHISKLTKSLSKSYTLWSEETNPIANNLLIIDCIGILSKAYQYADVAIVGGGFANALHNILEPAAFGKPVLFGPNQQKYPEASALKEFGGGFVFANETDLKNLLLRFYENTNYLKTASQSALDWIEDNIGATDKIIRAANF